ncbi:HAD family hydrolase [Paracoccus sp. (in: a-proteobacteria)]|uniref:HAD family hydrolase n=1 Tax=Paracoccus sp. TaxID=267 RepID=UPI003A8990FE
MKHIVFDLGQVLIHWDPECAFDGVFATRQELRDWMGRVGFDDWNRRQDAGRDLAEGLAEADRSHGADAAPLHSYCANFAATIANPIPGTWDIAETLKSAGHRLFAITNWSADNWPAAIACYPRLNTLFEDVVVSGIERLLKPAPEIYLTLTRRNGIAPGDCIFIDDSAANVTGARAIGMDAILFADAPGLRAELAKRGIG